MFQQTHGRLHLQVSESAQTSDLSVFSIGRPLMCLDDRASTTFPNGAFPAVDYGAGTELAQWRKAMGHSAMDPAFHELRPWNEGPVIGAKRALEQQVWAIRFWLDQHRRSGSGRAGA